MPSGCPTQTVAHRFRASLRTASSGLAAIAGVVGFVAVLLELLLRASGHGPGAVAHPRANEPVLHRPEPDLGWEPQPGVYRYAGYTVGAQPITVTFWQDGSRATRRIDTRHGEEVLLVGDSMVMGWAVSDDETFAWHLQADHPELNVRNFGVGGYGTVQTLLRLRRLLVTRLRPPRTVLYGFGEWQALRNVAHPAWLIGLYLQSPRPVTLPYCSLDDTGRIEWHPPTSFLPWPWYSRSALVATLQQAISMRSGAAREAQERPVTEALVEQMRDEVEARGTRFVTAFLGKDARYRDHIVQKGVQVVDCGAAFKPGMTVPGESHPNSAVHAAWARCLDPAL